MKCFNCHDKLNNLDSLKTHRKNVHVAIDRNKPIFKCKICNYKSSTLDSVSRHNNWCMTNSSVKSVKTGLIIWTIWKDTRRMFMWLLTEIRHSLNVTYAATSWVLWSVSSDIKKIWMTYSSSIFNRARTWSITSNQYMQCPRPPVVIHVREKLNWRSTPAPMSKDTLVRLWCLWLELHSPRNSEI